MPIVFILPISSSSCASSHSSPSILVIPPSAGHLKTCPTGSLSSAGPLDVTDFSGLVIGRANCKHRDLPTRCDSVCFIDDRTYRRSMVGRRPLQRTSCCTSCSSIHKHLFRVSFNTDALPCASASFTGIFNHGLRPLL